MLKYTEFKLNNNIVSFFIAYQNVAYFNHIY